MTRMHRQRLAKLSALLHDGHEHAGAEAEIAVADRIDAFIANTVAAAAGLAK